MPSSSDVVVMTDQSSAEGSSAQLARAVELVTGAAPLILDARHFYDGGDGALRLDGRLVIPSEALDVQPSVLIVYEIPPHDRSRFTRFQADVARSGIPCLGADAQAWRNATDKRHTVDRFRAAGIAQAESLVLDRPTLATALTAFDRLGRNVWARPAVGFGGRDVFHITTAARLHAACEHYRRIGSSWLLTRDAHNFDEHGRRHQYRVVVLGERVLRVCEHVQTDPDAPCNESRGAISTVLAPDVLPQHLRELAVRATASVGLPFGGVDLVPERGGAVFEVNVHPVLDVPQGFETVAVPFVLAHLTDATVNVPARPESVRPHR
ncbi:alpha-L-glutamate ligase [Nocardia colli]|uniref:Alpha-L-glutamate ligase n=1 Tax=Nocardia colli TaxID=2545717 RepID=A0A5N0E9D6_9NOCA|nr:alpha-L-glutamate ligase [Nocardia colli]KAA8886048.1 alpha-L-glutamate ligase [Nocardia colli]